MPSPSTYLFLSLADALGFPRPTRHLNILVVLIKGSILKLTSSEPPSYRLKASARTFVSKDRSDDAETADTSLERRTIFNLDQPNSQAAVFNHATSTCVGLGWELVGMAGASQLTLALERRGYRQKCLKDNHHDVNRRIWIGMVEVLQAIFHSSAMLLFNSKPLVLFNLDADFVPLVVLIRAIFDLFFCRCLVHLSIVKVVPNFQPAIECIRASGSSRMELKPGSQVANPRSIQTPNAPTQFHSEYNPNDIHPQPRSLCLSSGCQAPEFNSNSTPSSTPVHTNTARSSGSLQTQDSLDSNQRAIDFAHL
ncbi:hypothetical protein C8R47DRAFT_1319219 [Mycena vitilis]|nr:hypothetical protein C8R47DRAFT_1319219 [Mycena vitilis]